MRALVCLLLCVSWPPFAASAEAANRSGIVVEESGGAIAGAQLVLRSTHGAVVWQAVTKDDGSFTVVDLPPGSYVLEVSAQSFTTRRLKVELPAGGAPTLEVVLGLARFFSEVTVTAQRGMVGDTQDAMPVVIVRDEDDLRGRPIATIGNALEGAPGVMVQQSTYGQVSPFLRGLTGYHVLNLIDGVRFNNSTFRSGPNQYLAFAEPSQAQRIEAMLGPASSQFGSDALGGAIQLLTPAPAFASGAPFELNGGVNLLGASADTSSAGDLTLHLARSGMSWTVGGAWRQLNDVRGGGGRDTHHALRRFFGLSDEQIRDVTGSRQRGTGFTQSGVHTKMSALLGGQQNLTLWYQRSDVDGVQGYKDLWGGLGRLRSDFEPQRLDFFYTRYEKLDVGRLDWVSATFSVNSQADGSIRQGLRATDRVIADDGRVDALGYAVQSGVHAGARQAIVFGGEIYDERIDARRTETDPRTGLIEQKRALYPNGSKYRTQGLFFQDVVQLAGGNGSSTLLANVGGRFTRIDVDTFADRNRTALGQSLGVVDSSRSFQDWTFNAGLTWHPTRVLSFNVLTGRGFRAPNLNDLGALGLNDLGYEIPAESTLDAGALIGASDGEGTVSNGRPVGSLKAERLFNYEMGAAVQWPRFYARAQVFDAELKDPIVRRTLVFPIDSPPTALAGVQVSPIAPTAAQRAQGVVNVATTFDPRAVKAFVNDGQARYYGLDTLFSYRASTRWTVEGNYSYLVGHDLNPTRAVRRLPPQQGYVSLRYVPGGKRPWIEASALISGAQTNLSGGDLTDERIGASRRRSDVTDFFQGGLIAPFLLPGSDGRLGTTDDLFAPTNETVGQIRDRVLPIGATINGVRVADDGTRVPLYVETPGFLSVNVRAGVAIARNLRINAGVLNLFDRSYRIHGSGVDAPGINAYAGLSVSY